MKFLILCESYPSNTNQYAMAYIHTRVKQYQRVGSDVTILSFSATADYCFDGVNVYTPDNLKIDALLEDFDVVISHAPNLRNHFRFLIKNTDKISSIVFFFHGHEVMHLPREYPKPYTWNHREKVNRLIHSLYDPIKLIAVKWLLRYLSKHATVKYIFVSDWMKKTFEANIFICEDSNSRVINNSISSHFSKASYERSGGNEALSALCIRPLDSSKYAVDLVLDMASFNPNVTVDIFGIGSLPKVVSATKNVTFFQKYFAQAELPKLLNNYDLAIMPTRLDSQGVSVCEFAKYGIPLITSDIPIMREMLGGFSNVTFISNEKFEAQIETTFLEQLKYTPNLKTENKFELCLPAFFNIIIFYCQ